MGQGSCLQLIFKWFHILKVSIYGDKERKREKKQMRQNVNDESK